MSDSDSCKEVLIGVPYNGMRVEQIQVTDKST